MHKKKQLTHFLTLLFISIFIVLLEATPVNAAKPSVRSHAYVVMDANSGKIIYSHNRNKRIYPASTTKVMTAMVALDKADLSTKIRYSGTMYAQMNTYAAEQHVPLKDIAHLSLSVGATYTVEQYLKMMLLYSDADSAVALAIGTGGSIKNFSKLMNNKAKSFGMKGTTFDNPVGFDRGKGSTGLYTTAKDFAVMSRHAMTYKEIRDIVCKSSSTVRGGFGVRNKNRLAGYKNKNYQVIGLKTGTSGAAGHVLITVAKDKKGHEIICAFFGNSSEARMYSDIRSLLDYTFMQNKKGNISLSKGFWDCRFRDSEKLINKYANKGIINGEDGRFYPTKAVTPGELKTYIKKIAGARMSFPGKKKVTVEQFVDSYNAFYNTDYDIEYLEENDILGDVDTDPEHCITREEAVVIADGLSH